VLLALLVTRVDLIVLTHAASMEEAGRYAAPYRIYEAGMMIPSMATFVLFPALVRMFAAAPAQFPLMVQLVMRSGLVLATPVVLVLCFAASDIMRVVFGAAYVTAHGVLQVLAVNLLLLWLHQTLANALMAAGRQKLDLIANAFACALYLPLLYFLAGARGAIGAALAMTLMWAVQVALRLWFLRDAPSQASTLGGLGKVALAGAAAALVSFGLAPRLGYGALALGLVAYALAIFWCRAFTRADAHGVGQALAMRVAS